MILQLLVNGLVAGCIYAMVALGFGLIYNTTKIFHIAHGIVYTAAAYLLYTFVDRLGLSFVWSFILALIFATLLGVCIEAFIYYPFYRRKASLSVVMIGSLGVYIFLVNFIAMLYGNETKVLLPGVGTTFSIGSIILTKIQLLEVLTFLILFPLSIRLFLHLINPPKYLANPVLNNIICRLLKSVNSGLASIHLMHDGQM